MEEPTQNPPLLSEVLSDALIESIDNKEPLNSEVMAAISARSLEFIRRNDISELDPKFMKVIERVHLYWYKVQNPDLLKGDNPEFIFDMGILRGLIFGIDEVIRRDRLQAIYESSIDRLLRYIDVFSIINSTKAGGSSGISLTDLCKKTEHSKVNIYFLVHDFSQFNFFDILYLPMKDSPECIEPYFLGLTPKGKDALADLQSRAAKIENESKHD